MVYGQQWSETGIRFVKERSSGIFTVYFENLAIRDI